MRVALATARCAGETRRRKGNEGGGEAFPWQHVTMSNNTIDPVQRMQEAALRVQRHVNERGGLAHQPFHCRHVGT